MIILGIDHENGDLELEINQIIDLYNEAAGDNESHMNIKIPEALTVFRPMGIKGGIVVNQTNGYEQNAVIMFAALDDSYRGQGIIRELIEAANEYLAQKGSRIVGVALNPLDDQGIWKHLGFTHEGTINLTPHLFNQDMSELFPEATQGIDIADLMRLFKEIK